MPDCPFGRRLPHLVGCLAKLPRGVAELGPVLLARQLLETSRRFFDLFGERSLLVAAAAALLAGLRPPSLPLGFLLLAPRQLLQLLEQLVELLVGLLLLRALRRLVLVGHLVELELEQVGQVLGHRALPTATAATLLAAHLHLRLVLFFGLLQDLQRLLLGLERALRIGLLQLRLGVLHLRHRLRQKIGDLLERRILLHETAVHPREQAVDLIAQLRLRQREHDRVLAQLVGRHRLAIAIDVEGRRDDLALLLRERADLSAAAAAAAAGARIRLGAAELLPQRTDLQEVDVARLPLAAAGVVVGGARVVGHEVARP